MLLLVCWWSTNHRHKTGGYNVIWCTLCYVLRAMYCGRAERQPKWKLVYDCRVAPYTTPSIATRIQYINQVLMVPIPGHRPTSKASQEGSISRTRTLHLLAFSDALCINMVLLPKWLCHKNRSSWQQQMHDNNLTIT